jgi:hypothetical protein
MVQASEHLAQGPEFKTLVLQRMKKRKRERKKRKEGKRAKGRREGWRE